jgi:hypothetical protein
MPKMCWVHEAIDWHRFPPWSQGLAGSGQQSSIADMSADDVSADGVASAGVAISVDFTTLAPSLATGSITTESATTRVMIVRTKRIVMLSDAAYCPS